MIGNFIFPVSILYSLFTLVSPTIAVLTLNQEWSFDIDFLGVTYKPWRFFLLVCGIPSLLCALVLLLVLPESPKFTYSQGNEEKTLKILQSIYSTNTGKPLDSYEVKSIVKDGEFNERSNLKSENFFKFMWSQSVPLFQGSHLRNILTACFVMFSICLSGNGFWTFLPEIMNKVSLWTDASKGSATICEVFRPADDFRNATDVVQASLCVEKLELSTFIYVFILSAGHTIIFGIFSLIINYTGKLLILVSVLATCGTSALLLMFVEAPVVSSYLYVAMLHCGLGISIVNASTVELFPTKMRFVV
jgi:MFS transporter, VNT family, synaptic vesicle glycoprotein 2